MSPLKAGVAFVPFTLGIIVGAGASQALIRRIGIRIVVFTGITMGIAGLLYFARLPAHGSYVPDLLPTIAIVSVGMGMTFVPLTLLATTNVESRTPGWRRGSSTRRNRSAAHSGSRFSRRWPLRGRATSWGTARRRR